MEGKVKLDGYTWQEARGAFKKASFMMDEIELPAIFSCFSWRGLRCLELSRNGDARLALSSQNQSKHTTILVPNKDLVGEIKKNVKAKGVGYGKAGKIEALPFDPKFGLEIQEKYDVVYAEWISHNWLENRAFLESMLIASKKYFLVVMPHPDSDDTKIASIENPDERNRRVKARDNLKKLLEENGWRVNYFEKELPLRFESAGNARKTFYCSVFNNLATPEQKKTLDSFLSEKKAGNFDDKFYILWAEKT